MPITKITVTTEYKSVEVPYNGDVDFTKKLNYYAKKGWRTVSVFVPDPSWKHSVVIVLEKVLVDDPEFERLKRVDSRKARRKSH